MLEEISIKNKKGLKLAAVLGTPGKTGEHPAVILLHGFTGYKKEEHIASLGNFLTENGYVTIRFDCSGFGESEGKTWDEYRVSNYVSDIESVYDFLIKQEFVDTKRVATWGQSMGGMLSIIFASLHPEIKTVCAVSAPTMITRADALEGWLKEWKEKGYFDKWSSTYGEVKIPYEFVEDANRWSALEAIKKVKVPLLIILGKDDDTVFPEDTKELYEAGNQPKELVEIDGMGHDYKKNPAQIEVVNKLVLSFLNKNIFL